MKYKITAEYEDAHSITIISSMIVVDTEYTLGYKEFEEVGINLIK